jgi:DNA primase
MLLSELVAQDYTLIGTGRWLRAQEHNSLVVDSEKQIFFWNSRGIYGNAFSWLTRVRGLSYAEAKEIVGNDSNDTSLFIPTVGDVVSSNNNTSVVPLPELVDLFWKMGKGNRDYWLDYRGLTDETIDRFRLGWTGEWFVIPIYVDGKFANFQCRKQNPKVVRPWYYGLGALPFNFSILTITDWVVITEGPPDAIMCRQNNIPAVSQTAGAGHFKASWLPKFGLVDKVYVVYNDDEAGNNGAKKTADWFGYRAKVFNFWDSGKQGYDITDYFKDGNSREDFIELLENKSKYAWELP